MTTSPPNLRNWDRARIANKIAYVDPNDNTVKFHQLKLVNRISIRELHDFVPYGGITEWNQGYIEKAPQYSFTLAIPATSVSVRLLRAIHSSGLSFNMEIFDATVSDDNRDQEFALIKEVLIECKLTGKEANIVVADLPMIAFNGLALRATYTDGNTDSAMKGNVNTTDPKIMFGSGAPIPNSTNLFSEVFL
jgi:hypothetical protein